MPDTLRFTKMHGLGNDFVMLSGQDILPDGVSLEKLAAFLCDRHFGIGADGLILPAPPSDPNQFDIKFVYLNGDGSWAEMCGNGIRCFARYVQDLGLIDQSAFTAETLAGPIRPEINADGSVTVDMGPPILAAEKIPFSTGMNGIGPGDIVQNYNLPVLETSVPVSAVSMGNPHCLIFQGDLPARLDPARYGPAIETHAAFPAKTNVEFIDVLDRGHVNVTVWERGCGFTQACGTGACATAVAAIQLGKVDSRVTVTLPGGDLEITWDGNPASSVYMRGPAETVFRGEVILTPERLKSLAR